MKYTQNQWSDMLKAMWSGQEIEIDHEIWYHFLEVLPPARMPWDAVFNDGTERKGCDFGFAEGCDCVTAFWAAGKGDDRRYFCRRTTQMNPWG